MKLLLSFLFLITSLQAADLRDFKWSESNGEITITEFWTNLPGHVEIPNAINGLPVTAIGDSVFRDNIGILSVTIPEGITSVGSAAFYNCSSLQSVILPDSILSLGDNCFHGCYELAEISIPINTTSIGSGTFNECRSLEAIS